MMMTVSGVCENVMLIAPYHRLLTVITQAAVACVTNFCSEN